MMARLKDFTMWCIGELAPTLTAACVVQGAWLCPSLSGCRISRLSGKHFVVTFASCFHSLIPLSEHVQLQSCQGSLKVLVVVQLGRG